MSSKQQLEDTISASFAVKVRPQPQPSSMQGETGGRRRDPKLCEIHIDRIRPDEDQVRQRGKGPDDTETKRLADSIKDKGILQPLNVRYIHDDDIYEIIAGERRYTAAKLVGLEYLPCKISNVDDKEAAQLQLIENLHRKDLAPLDIGAALQQMADQGNSVSQLAKLLYKGKPWVTKHLTIFRKLSDEAKAIALDSPSQFQSLGHLYEVAQLPADQQVAVLRHTQEHGLSRTQLQQITAAAKRTSKGKNRVGRPTKAKSYSKIITVDSATVTVKFRKSRATQGEVVTSLRDALALLEQSPKLKEAA